MYFHTDQDVLAKLLYFLDGFVIYWHRVIARLICSAQISPVERLTARTFFSRWLVRARAGAVGCFGTRSCKCMPGFLMAP